MMEGMSEDAPDPPPCTGPASGCECADCQALRGAAAAGARPKGVPLRVYGAYLEARAALRKGAHSLANRTLAWLLAQLAEERGARPEESLAAKVERLRQLGVILPRLQRSLLDRAVSTGDTPERAWALLSIVEHSFHRLYLQGPHPRST
jgi:hypothetical protein